MSTALPHTLSTEFRKAARRSAPCVATFRMTFLGTVLALVAMFAATDSVRSAVPEISFQGYLTDGADVPVTTDSVGVTVDAAIYDDETGGNRLWSSSFFNVVITDGLFDVSLGSGTPLDAADFSGIRIYLELSIDGEPPLPRTELKGAPFAVRSHVADLADGLAPGTGVTSINGLTDDVIVAGGNNIDVSVDGNTIKIASSGGGGADNDWNIVGSDQHSAVSGNVGVGTSDPDRKFHVLTDDLGIDDADMSTNFDLVVESDDATLGLFSDTGGLDGSKIVLSEVSGGNVADQWSILRKTALGGRGLAFQFSEVGEVARFGPNGNLGLGTDDPLRRLHVMTDDQNLTDAGLSPNYDVVVESSDAVLGLFSDNGGQDGSTLIFGEVSGGNITNSWNLRRKTTGGSGDLQLSFSDVGEVVRFGSDGDIGIGTSSPASKLDVRGSGSFEQDLLLSQPIINQSATLRFQKTTSAANLVFGGSLLFQLELFGTPTDVMWLTTNGAIINGTTTTDVLEITGGSDLAEPFDVEDSEEIEPGMVLSIDPLHTGELRVADSPYDRTVAGIASGANGIQPGITLKQEGTVADGSVPVALSGRVYCLVDASYGAIQPGDLLTTSGTPGHAMKASDPSRTPGAVIGKAMSSLEDGRGTVLVLVSLQ